MAHEFDFMNLNFFTKASVYPGSIGTFRYRFQRTGWINDGQLQAWVYENICFEKAKDIETITVDWTDDGIKELQAWLYQKLEERGSQPYHIPFPPAKEEPEPEQENP